MEEERKDKKLAEKAFNEMKENKKKGTLKELLKNDDWQNVPQSIKMQTGLRLWEHAKNLGISLNVLGKKNGATIYAILSNK